MRAADDLIGHYNGLGAVTPDEFKDRLHNRGIGPNIPLFGEPPLQKTRQWQRGSPENRDGPSSLVANLSGV